MALTRREKETVTRIAAGWRETAAYLRNGGADGQKTPGKTASADAHDACATRLVRELVEGKPAS